MARKYTSPTKNIAIKSPVQNNSTLSNLSGISPITHVSSQHIPVTQTSTLDDPATADTEPLPQDVSRESQELSGHPLSLQRASKSVKRQRKRKKTTVISVRNKTPVEYRVRSARHLPAPHTREYRLQSSG